jgi:hypothetical protein
MSIMRHVHSLCIGQRSRSLRMSSVSPRWLPPVLKILFSRARLGARDSSPLHRLSGAMPRMVKTNVFLTWCPVSFECGKTKHLREASSKEAAEQALAEHLRRQPAHVQAGIDEATIEDFVSIASYCRCEKLVMTRSSRRPKIGDKAHGQGGKAAGKGGKVIGKGLGSDTSRRKRVCTRSRLRSSLKWQRKMHLADANCLHNRLLRMACLHGFDPAGVKKCDHQTQAEVIVID